MGVKRSGLSFVNITLISIIIAVSGVVYFSIYDKGGEEPKVEMVEVVPHEETKTYYYNQISEGAKIMYSTILSNIEILKNSNKEIKFPNDDRITDKDFQTAWDAFMLDRPEYFFLDANNVSLVTRKTTFLATTKLDYSLAPFKRNSNGEYLPYSSKFSEGIRNVDLANKEIESAANKIINVVNQFTKRYDKIKYIHDFFVNNTEYNQNEDFNNNNIYGLFVNHKCMCQGYAYSMKYICDIIGIPCIIVNGYGINNNNQEELHAWNYIKMEDGKWYAIDVTWDDPIVIGSGKISDSVKYKYFLKGSDSFFKNHIENGDVSKTGQNFYYEEISKMDYIK